MEINCLTLSTLSSMWGCTAYLSAKGWQERCFAPFWAREELSSAGAPAGFGGSWSSSVPSCSPLPAPDRCREIIPMWVTHRQHGTTQHSMPWGFSKGQNFLSLCASCSLGICWWQNLLSICKMFLSHLCYQTLRSLKEKWWWLTLWRHFSHHPHLLKILLPATHTHCGDMATMVTWAHRCPLCSWKGQLHPL